MTAPLTADSVDHVVERLRRTNRSLKALAIALAVLVVVIGVWAIPSAISSPENTASAEIRSLLDEYMAAHNNADSEAFLKLVTSDYLSASSVEEFDRESAALEVETAWRSYGVERIGEPIMVGNGPWIVAEAADFSYGSGSTELLAVFTIVEDDGRLKVQRHIANIPGY